MIKFKSYTKDGFSIDIPEKFRVKMEFPKLYAKAHGSCSSVVVEEILNRENLESRLRIPDPISHEQAEIKVVKFELPKDPIIGRSIYFTETIKLTKMVFYGYNLYGETKFKKMYSVGIVLDEKFSMEIVKLIVASIKFETELHQF